MQDSLSLPRFIYIPQSIFFRHILCNSKKATHNQSAQNTSILIVVHGGKNHRIRVDDTLRVRASATLVQQSPIKRNQSVEFLS